LFFQENNTCPTCEQQITESFKENKISDLKNSKAEKTTILKELEDKILSLEDVQDKIVSWVEEVNDLSSSINATKSKIDFIVKTMSSYKKDIDELTKNSLTIIDDSELYSELDELRKRKETLVQQREIYNVGIILLKDGGIKAKIIKQYIPIINQMINKYLDDMEFFCQFTIDETFEEKIKSRYRDDFTFESFSEGEKMRLNLAILFTWRELAKMRNSAATNLLILDEIMDSSLDSSGTEEFIKIIQSLTKKNNVFVISHKTDQIQERFENVIRFEKTKNFSKVVE
jgi:DNA repair ATPase RecN